MTTFDFPASPTDGQVYTPAGGPSYVWHTPTWYLSTPAGLTDAPSDGSSYGRFNATWAKVAPLNAPAITGGLTVSTGNLTVSGGGNISAGGGVTAGANVLATGATYGTTGCFADGTGNFGLFAAGNKRSLLLSGGSGYQNTIDTSTGVRQWISFDGTTVQMALAFNGDLTIQGGTATKPGSSSWTAPSDARIKDVQGNYEHGLTEICALQPVRYRYKSGVQVLGGPETKPAPMFAAEVVETDFIGLVAQDTEPHLPECVGVSEQTVTVDGATVVDLRTLDTGPLLFALVNAVKTLAARVTELESAVA